MADVEEKSSVYSNQLNLALNYGARDELARAFNLLYEEHKSPITPDDISRALYTKDQPDVDLIIRTGGEKRLSNFLLFQSAYAELYFTDKYWPDIKNEDIDEAILFYQNKDRRFGGLTQGR